jgi:hypothetical protein
MIFSLNFVERLTPSTENPGISPPLQGIEFEIKLQESVNATLLKNDRYTEMMAKEFTNYNREGPEPSR